jgi:hypothetical protein
MRPVLWISPPIPAVCKRMYSTGQRKETPARAELLKCERFMLQKQKKKKQKQTPWPLVRERTIPTDRPPLVDEI